MDHFKLKYPELKADIYYLTEEEGGRKSPVYNGYRGQFYYNGRDWDAPQQFINKEVCEPGDTVSVYMQTLSPDFHAGRLVVGQKFEIREGAKIVGRGVITDIIKEEFEYWDYPSFYAELPADCAPFDQDDLNEFLSDMKYGLEVFTEIKEVVFTIDLDSSDSMLTVQCILHDKTIRPRPLIDKVCEQWRVGGISLINELYKTELNYKKDIFDFCMQFATWDTSYLTGRILISNM